MEITIHEYLNQPNLIKNNVLFQIFLGSHEEEGLRREAFEEITNPHI